MCFPGCYEGKSMPVTCQRNQRETGLLFGSNTVRYYVFKSRKSSVLDCVWWIMHHSSESIFKNASSVIWKCDSVGFYTYIKILTWSHQYLALWCMEVWPWLSSYLLQAVETCTPKNIILTHNLDLPKSHPCLIPFLLKKRSAVLSLPLGATTLSKKKNVN